MKPNHAPATPENVVNSEITQRSVAFLDFSKFFKSGLVDLINEHSGSQKRLLAHLPLLPKFIQKTTENISSEHQKLIMLSAVLPVTSALFANVKIKYNSTMYTPTLSLIVVAPPASGKGLLKYAIRLPKLVDDKLKQSNKQLLDDYFLKLNAFSKKGKGVLTTAEKPQKPYTPCVLFPANMTNAALVQQLKYNENGPVLLVSALELDTIASSFSSEHGRALNSSFRVITEQEPLDSATKTDGNIIVERPMASFLFASTMSQFTSMFKSNKTGFYSRFLIMKFPNQAEFDITSGKSSESLDEQFNELSQEYLKFFDHMSGKNVETIIGDDQLAHLQELGSILLSKVMQMPSLGEDAISLVYRHINMCFRLASTLRMLQYCENEETDTKVEISEEIIAWSLMYTMVSFSNSMTLFQNMSVSSVTMDKCEMLYNSLPDTFNVKGIAPLLSNLDIEERHGYNVLNNLISQGKVIKKGHAKYEKVTKLSAV